MMMVSAWRSPRGKGNLQSRVRRANPVNLMDQYLAEPGTTTVDWTGMGLGMDERRGTREMETDDWSRQA